MKKLFLAFAAVLLGVFISTAVAETLSPTLDYQDVEISQLAGTTIKRVVPSADGSHLYILAHKDAAPIVLVYNHETKAVKEQLGTTNCVIDRGTSGVTDILSLSDIDVTDDGVLIGIGQSKFALNASSKGIYTFKWVNGADGVATGQAAHWNVTGTNNVGGGNWGTAIAGEAMAYRGTITSGYIFYSSQTASGTNIRWIRKQIVDGVYKGTDYYNNQCTATPRDAALFADHASGLMDHKQFILTREGKGINLMGFKEANGTSGVTTNSAVISPIPVSARHTPIFAYGTKYYMIGATSTGFALANVTEGIIAGEAVTINTTALAENTTTNVAAAGTQFGGTNIAFFVIRDGKISRYSIQALPSITANPTAVSLEVIAGGEAKYADVTIAAENLSADLAITTTTGEGVTITPQEGWNARTGGTLRIALDPTKAAGSHSGVITVASGTTNAEIDVTAAIKGKMAGTYTVGGEGADYASLAAACAAVNGAVITGDITLAIATDLTETVKTGIINISEHTITIRPATAELRTITYDATIPDAGWSGSFFIGAPDPAHNVEVATKNVILDGCAEGSDVPALAFVHQNEAGRLVVYGAAENIIIRNIKSECQHTGTSNSIIQLRGEVPTNITISGCTLIGKNVRRIIDMSNAGAGITIENNTFVGKGVQIGNFNYLIYTGSGTGVIRGNRFTELSDGDAQGICAISPQGGTWTIENNYFSGLDFTGSGASRLVYIRTISTSTAIIRHNTFYIPSFTSKPDDSAQNTCIELAGKNTIENNLFVLAEETAQYSFMNTAPTAVKNNVFYHVANAKAYIQGTTAWADYSTKEGVTDKWAEPKFVDAAAGDLSLSAGGEGLLVPAIAEVATDINGTARGAEKAYAGAFEYVAPADTYVVAGVEELCGSNWSATDQNNLMTEADGVYTKVYTNVPVGKNYQFKVVKNGSEWIGDATGNNITFHVTEACDVTVTYNPATNEITVTGTGVILPTGLEIEAIYAVGNGSGNWLNGAEWNPAAEANKMTEVSPFVYQITYTAVPKGDEYEVKFAANGTWADSWGSNEFVMESVEDHEAFYNGENIIISHEYKFADITLELDLTAFDYTTKTGAKFSVTITEKEVELASFTVKFQKPADWEKVYIHVWGYGVTETTWPGTELTPDAQGWVSYSFENALPCFIFNNGGNGVQSADMAGITEDVCYTWQDGGLVATDCPAPVTTMQGTYTVGGEGADFASLAEATAAVNAAPITGDVTLLIAADLEETANVGIINTTDYTVTIRPNEAEMRIITFTQADDNAGASGSIIIGMADAVAGTGETASKNIVIDGSAEGSDVRNLTIVHKNKGGRIVPYGAVSDIAIKDVVLKNEAVSISGDNYGCAIQLRGTDAGKPADITISGCDIKAANHTWVVIFTYGKSLLFENNIMDMAGTMANDYSYGLHGASVEDTVIVRGNQFINVTSSDASGVLALSPQGGTWIIENNYFSGMDYTGAEGVATRINYIRPIGDAKEVIIRHNTFYIPSFTVKPANEDNLVAAIENVDGAPIIENNIFVSAEETAQHAFFSQTEPTQVKNNVFYTVAENAKAFVVGDKTVAAYLEADTLNNKTAEVHFTDAAAGDLSLTGTSDGDIDLAVPAIAEVTTDITGKVRHAETVYAGAWEGIDFIIPDTYIVAGVEALCGSNWDGKDEANLMTETAEGVYTKVYTAVPVGKNYQLKVVKNGTDWIGDATGNNVTFHILQACDVTVTYTVATGEITVIGEGVSFEIIFEIEAMRAVGNGSEHWLNGANWDPASDLNKMVEVSDSVYQITFTSVPKGDGYEVKFAANGSWTDNWGPEGNEPITASVENWNALYNSSYNITINNPFDVADITLTLNLTAFDYVLKTGATYSITIVDKTPTALDNAAAQQIEVRKVIENGQVVIIKDGIRYNVLGVRIM